MSEDLILKCLIAFILGWIVSRYMGDGFSVGVSYKDLPESCRADRTEDQAYVVQAAAAARAGVVIEDCENDSQVPDAHPIGKDRAPNVAGCEKYIQCNPVSHLGGFVTDSGCRKCSEGGLKHLSLGWCTVGKTQIECPNVAPKCIKYSDNYKNPEYLKCLQDNYGAGSTGSKCGFNLALTNCYERDPKTKLPACTIDEKTSEISYIEQTGNDNGIIYTFLPTDQTCTKVPRVPVPPCWTSMYNTGCKKKTTSVVDCENCLGETTDDFNKLHKDGCTDDHFVDYCKYQPKSK